MNNNEPIVLGKVKKGAAGKPLLVVIIFLFVGAIILFLPAIIESLKTGKFTFTQSNGKTQSNTTTQKLDNNIPKVINSKTIFKYDRIILDNFRITTTDIKFNLNKPEDLKINELNYYLILSQNDKEIATIKLNETTEEIKFDFINNLENTVEIKGIIKKIQENEYPEFVVSSDETGIGSLICKKDNYEIEYVLNNNKLTKIKEILNYVDDGNNYLSVFEKYSKQVSYQNNLNAISSIEENFTGFIYKTEIDLITYKGEIKNNYYSLNTKTNKINFEMKAKGYDCK